MNAGKLGMLILRGVEIFVSTLYFIIIFIIEFRGGCFLEIFSGQET